MTTDQQIAHSQVADHRRWLAAGWPLAGRWLAAGGAVLASSWSSGTALWSVNVTDGDESSGVRWPRKDDVSLTVLRRRTRKAITGREWREATGKSFVVVQRYRGLLPS
jgi:hypothetical protein